MWLGFEGQYHNNPARIFPGAFIEEHVVLSFEYLFCRIIRSPEISEESDAYS